VEPHRTSGRRGLGRALAISTMLLWAVLPFALQGILVALDPFTITWSRFLVSSLLLAAILAARGNLPSRAQLAAAGPSLLLAATLGLAANYVLSLVGLHWTSPSDSQVLIQLGPMLLALGGIALFRERPTRVQWIGFALLLAGLAGFFASRVGGSERLARSLPAAAAVIALAALSWAIYGLAQKQLLRRLSSTHVLLCVYVGCALVFLPLAQPVRLASLDPVQTGLLAFAALNTLLAYGAFAESLAHWEASRVGAVLALSPLATLALAALFAVPWAVPSAGEPLGAASWASALLVIGGSVAAALGGEATARPDA
jgi:drug/metabolite transporter (DMT)-like permease